MVDLISPDRADILLYSDKKKEIKAKAGRWFIEKAPTFCFKQKAKLQILTIR
jgi:hypothetical protein